MANKETLELVSFLATVANALEKSFRDGKLNVQDFGNFISAAIEAPNAIQGINLIGEEIKNWTEEEKAQAIVLFQEKLDFAADNIESAVEDIFTAILLLISGVTKLGIKTEGDIPNDTEVSE